MSPDRALFGIVAIALPVGAIAYALIATGIMALRKAPEPPHLPAPSASHPPTRGRRRMPRPRRKMPRPKKPD